MDDCPFATSIYSIGVEALDLHPNPVLCVVMGFGSPVTVENNREQVRGDVVVIRSGCEHRISCAGGLRAMFLDGIKWSGADVVAERLEGSTAFLAESGMADADSRTELRERLSLGQPRLSPPVRDALTLIATNTISRMTQAELSQLLNLERTQAMRQFKAEAGMTFRQFKRWSGLRQAAQAITAGELVRTAALDAGFADTAHLSRTFRTSFGLTPTQALAGLEKISAAQ
jgi:methylphosphotriester-DNA--protein-cysteine methyltransferase